MKYTALATMLLASPVFANQPDLSALVSDTLGYVTVRSGVVLMEGEDMGTFICKIDASDEAFAEYLETGQLVEEKVGYACIPVEEFEK